MATTEILGFFEAVIAAQCAGSSIQAGNTHGVSSGSVIRTPS